MMLRSWFCGCIELSSKLNGKVTWWKNTPRRTLLEMEDRFLPVPIGKVKLPQTWFLKNGVLGNYDPIQSELAQNVTLQA
jgi:hypothetical protein